MALESREKQQAYRDRMKARGFVAVHELVPVQSKALVRDICRGLREHVRPEKEHDRRD